jgi:hypothetical protein
MFRRSLTPLTALLLCFAAFSLVPERLSAQFGPPPPEVVRPAKEVAPEDLTGHWVAIVTEDWRWRMLTPAKGDFTSVPLNRDGRKAAEAWAPDKDISSGNQCKAYGAPAIMRMPARLNISWSDDNTLKVEIDAGTQARLFHFNSKPHSSEAPSWQGLSAATWELRPSFRPDAARVGSLKVVTTNLKPGYLRKNGVPYSGNTELTEYYDRTNEPNGDSWLVVTTIVHDPVNLAADFITSSHFKREKDGSKWAPTACEAK